MSGCTCTDALGCPVWWVNSSGRGDRSDDNSDTTSTNNGNKDACSSGVLDGIDNGGGDGDGARPWDDTTFLPRLPDGSVFRQLHRRLVEGTRHVVLGGGGVYGVMYIGALLALCQFSRDAYSAWLTGIKDVAGTSAGAIIACLLAAGMDPWQMRECLFRCDLAATAAGILDVSLHDIGQVKGLSTGLATNRALQDLVAAATGRADITLQQLYARTHRRLVIVVTNGRTNRTEFWCHVTRPTMPVWLALRCSSSVPGLLAPPEVDGALFYDGGLSCNLPCHLFPARDTLTLFVHRPLAGLAASSTDAPTASTTKTPSPIAASMQPEAAAPSSDVDTTTEFSLRAMLRQVLAIYTNSAQLGPMRGLPGLLARAVPCVPASKSVVECGAFPLRPNPDLLTEVLADGCRSVNAVVVRDASVLALLTLFIQTTKRVPPPTPVPR